jgi:hypothetical protein
MGISLLLLCTDHKEVRTGRGLEFAPIVNEHGKTLSVYDGDDAMIRFGCFQTTPWWRCDIKERDRSQWYHFAADAIVRVSRVYQDGSGLCWPDRKIDILVRTVWGDIEDLIRVKGISEQWVPKLPVRTRMSELLYDEGDEIDISPFLDEELCSEIDKWLQQTDPR